MSLGPLMLDLTSTSLTAEEKELLKHPVVGGVILFARNIVDAAQVKLLTTTIQAEAGRHLLIAVDQEGGRVQRLKQDFCRLPPLRSIKTEEQAQQLGWLMAAEVRAVGCDISFAPVLDLDFGVSEVIGDRSLSANTQQVVTLARAYLRGMRDAGMLGTGKHFPGHGYVVADSHVAIPVDDRDLATIEKSCLQPYSALAQDLGAVMTAHVIYPAIDDKPAGFSTTWIRHILRQRLQFDGCVFSDDLAMHGATVVGDYTARARAALDAGCDMVLVCNDRTGAIQVLDSLPHHLDSEKQRRIRSMCMQKTSPELMAVRDDQRWKNAQQHLTA